MGLLTSARISPLRGSMATNAPRRLPYMSSMSFCSLMSIDSITLSPGVAAWLESLRTARPPAEVSICSTPVAPCRADSKLCSMPSLPMYSVPR
ncbi:hypothetical protein D3C72_2031580 [compost metagenome]